MTLLPGISGVKWCAVTVGFTGIVAQTLLLREILSQFGGSELYVGVIIGFWIAAEALGAMLVSRITVVARGPDALFEWLTLLFSLSFPLFILLSRLFKTVAGIPADQATTLVAALAGSLFLIAPTAMIHGAQFSAAMALYQKESGDVDTAPGRVYALDTFGAIAGGGVVTFLLLPYLSQFHSAALLALAGAVLLLLLSRRRSRGSTLQQSLRSALLLSLFGVLLAGGDRLDGITAAVKWQGRGLLYSIDSPYQNIAVIADNEQKSVYVDGRPSLYFPDPDIEAAELLSHIPLLSHPDPARVLIFGGCYSGLLPELLRHSSVRVIECLEVDPLLSATVQRFADPDSARAINDSRVRVLQRDAREFAAATGKRYDVILINAPLPENLLENRLFTLEFFQRVSALLAENGIAALLLPGSTAYYGTQMKRITGSLLETFRSGFKAAAVLPGDRNLFLGGGGSAVGGLSAAKLAARLQLMGGRVGSITPERLQWLFDKGQADWFYANFAAPGRLNSDFAPYLAARGVFHGAAAINPHLQPLFEGFEGFSLVSLLPYLLLCLVAGILLVRFRPMASLPITILTTGFSGMVLELALFLIFQILHGALVQTVGVMIALFMAGIWCGSRWTTAVRTESGDLQRLFAADCGLVVISGLLLLLVTWPLAHHLTGGASIAVTMPLIFMAGFATGMQFPPAARLYGRNNPGGAAAIYAFDLAGGCSGGFLGGLFLLPLLGFKETLQLLVMVKLGSMMLLKISRIGVKIQQ